MCINHSYLYVHYYVQIVQQWVKGLSEEWNRDWDKEVLEEWLREPKGLPGQPMDNIGEL